jgi:hypothetical protein
MHPWPMRQRMHWSTQADTGACALQDQTSDVARRQFMRKYVGPVPLHCTSQWLCLAI